MSSVRVLHFWSTTCGPCRTIKPGVETLKEDLEEKYGERISWVSVNTKDDRENYTQTYEISVVPSFVVLRNGTEVGRYSGTQLMILISIINKAFSS